MSEEYAPATYAFAIRLDVIKGNELFRRRKEELALLGACYNEEKSAK